MPDFLQLRFLHNEALAKLLLRLGLGGMLFLHGIAKVGSSGSLGFIKMKLAANGLPELLVYGVFVGELLAPVLLILGLYTRLAGALVVVTLLFAIGLVHTHELFILGQHGGWAIELQAFYLLAGLVVMLQGSGKYAVKPD